MIRVVARMARKSRPCDGYRHSHIIEPGDVYLSMVASPDHDGLGNLGWWRLAECEECAVTNGRGHLIVEHINPSPVSLVPLQVEQRARAGAPTPARENDTERSAG